MDISEQHLPGLHGDVRVRVYRPSRPIGVGIVWIHGGAFFMNDIDVPEAHWVAQRLADAGVTVVSPDYRLASDHVHFPVLSDECATAWAWATADPDLSTSVTQWHIGGGSAGGNLAASVSMQLRDEGRPLPLSDVLVYPALHADFPEPSAELAAKILTLPAEELYTPEQSEEINLKYVGDRALLHHPYAFPGYGRLEDMPPTLVVNSEFDPLRASGERYAAQLVEAGVDVTVIREPDAHHGHLNFPEQTAARRTVARMTAWLTTPALRGGRHDDGVASAVTVPAGREMHA